MPSAKPSVSPTLTPRQTWLHQHTRSRSLRRSATSAYSCEGGPPARRRHLPPNHPRGRGTADTSGTPIITGHASPHGLCFSLTRCPPAASLFTVSDHVPPSQAPVLSLEPRCF